jgi:hypothetical protein
VATDPVVLVLVVGDLAAEHEGSVGRGVCMGAVATGEAGRVLRPWDRRGGLVRPDRPRTAKLLAEQVDVRVDGLGVLLRAEGLVRLVAELRQRSSPKAA